jgi:hypothetical protein
MCAAPVEAQLQSSAWTQVKVGTFTLTVDKTSAFMLPCRDDDSVGFLLAEGCWNAIDGERQLMTATLKANDLCVQQLRGNGGFVVGFFATEQPEGGLATFLKVVSFKSKALADSASGRARSAGAADNTTFEKSTESIIQLEKVTAIRLATTGEKDELENNFYMSDAGRNYWDASEYGTKRMQARSGDDAAEAEAEEDDEPDDDARCTEAESLLSTFDSLLEYQTVSRAEHLAQDYQRYTGRVIFDKCFKGQKGALAVERHNRLADGLAAAGTLMAGHYCGGKAYDDITGAGQRERIRAAQAEIEGDLPPSLRMAVFGDEALAETLQPPLPAFTAGSPAAARPAPKKRGRGRPPGSRNKTTPAPSSSSGASTGALSTVLGNREVMSSGTKISALEAENKKLKEKLADYEHERTKRFEATKGYLARLNDKLADAKDIMDESSDRQTKARGVKWEAKINTMRKSEVAAIYDKDDLPPVPKRPRTSPRASPRARRDDGMPSV